MDALMARIRRAVNSLLAECNDRVVIRCPRQPWLIRLGAWLYQVKRTRLYRTRAREVWVWVGKSIHVPPLLRLGQGDYATDWRPRGR